MVDNLRRSHIEIQAMVPIMDHQASPLPYPGGKGRVANDLRRLVPKLDTFTTVIDPFGGGASTPLALSRMGAGKQKRFLIRDTFAPTINFWQVLQQAPWDMANAVDDLLHRYTDARDVFNNSMNSIRHWQETGLGAVDAAAGYYVYAHICWPQGLLRLKGTEFSPTKAGQWMKSAQFAIGRLIPWSELIVGWDFRQQDFRQTLAEATALGGEAFAFIDPPYEEMVKVLYNTTFGPADHDELARLVREANENGVKAMVTINHSPANLARYAGYHQVRREQVYGSKRDGKCNVGVELVILTYEPPFFTASLAVNDWQIEAEQALVQERHASVGGIANRGEPSPCRT